MSLFYVKNIAVIKLITLAILFGGFSATAKSVTNIRLLPNAASQNEAKLIINSQVEQMAAAYQVDKSEAKLLLAIAWEHEVNSPDYNKRMRLVLDVLTNHKADDLFKIPTDEAFQTLIKSRSFVESAGLLSTEVSKEVLFTTIQLANEGPLAFIYAFYQSLYRHADKPVKEKSEAAFDEWLLELSNHMGQSGQ